MMSLEVENRKKNVNLYKKIFVRKIYFYKRKHLCATTKANKKTSKKCNFELLNKVKYIFGFEKDYRDKKCLMRFMLFEGTLIYS